MQMFHRDIFSIEQEGKHGISVVYSDATRADFTQQQR